MSIYKVWRYKNGGNLMEMRRSSNSKPNRESEVNMEVGLLADSPRNQ
jgi:hypothetical protein